MLIQVLGVGRLKERYWVDACAEYQKRLGRYCRLAMGEVRDEPAPDTLSAAQVDHIRHVESARLLDKAGEDILAALDVQGTPMSSEAFARQLAAWESAGRSVTFVIGGSHGLSDELIGRAHCRISFGAMTYPHQMVRVMLLEQIYRGFKILRNETYHK